MKTRRNIFSIILVLLALGLLLAGCGGKSGQTAASTATYITETQAKEAALKHAGLAESDVTFLTARLDTDDKRAEYDVEFYSGKMEYDYEIDALTGKVRSFDKDVEHYDVQAAADAVTTDGGEMLTESQAKDIALKDAGIAEKDATFLHVKLEKDNARMEYEIEFYSGTTEYDYDIDAVTGEIRSKDFDAENGKAAAPSASATGDIGKAEAKRIALAHAGLEESQVSRLRVKKDKDDGVVIYEVEFDVKHTEYSYDIDAATGKILEYDKDIDF